MESQVATPILREWRVDDSADLAAQANDHRVWMNMRDAFPRPFGLADAERLIAVAISKPVPTFLAIEASGRVVGGIGYALHDDVERIGAEVGYWVGHEFWGRGIASAALRAITSRAFRAHEELERLYALPFSSNPASARVLGNAGYRRVGTLRQSVIKDGRVLDQWMYAILRKEWQAREFTGGGGS